ncbi:flagellar filament capping protein FliD [Sphingomonas sp. GlSt437]
MTTTSSTTSSLSNAQSVLTALNAGSGIDYNAIVTQLVAAEFGPQTQTLQDRSAKLDTQISAVGTLKSNLNDFYSSLSQLVSGGTLATQPTSSDSTIVKASVIPGQSASGLASSVEVRQLAQAQVATTGVVADPTAAVGTGKLTLQLGTATYANGAITGFTAGSSAPVSITIDSTNNSLQGIAKAINAANAGVTATILTDSSGARLSLKGKTGEAQAFTLTATEDASAPGLAALNIGVGATGTTIGSAAQDAVVAVDGVPLKRSTNSISDLVPGVKLDLVSAKPGTIVSLGASTPTDALSQAINNFVSAYNSLQNVLKGDLDAKTGTLFGDPAATSLATSLRGLTLTKLSTSASGPTTLTEIGVATNRDGTLTVNADQLKAAITNSPDAVEALFANGTGATGGGISAAFKAILDNATSTTYGLGASETNYNNAKTRISDQLSAVSTRQDAETTRLTQQFSNLSSQLASYKSTQSFLTQQIAAWNSKQN